MIAKPKSIFHFFKYKSLTIRLLLFLLFCIKFISHQHQKTDSSRALLFVRQFALRFAPKADAGKRRPYYILKKDRVIHIILDPGHDHHRVTMTLGVSSERFRP